MGFPDKYRAYQSPHALINEIGSISDQDITIAITKYAPPTIS